MKNNVVFKFPNNLIALVLVLCFFYIYGNYKDSRLKKCFKYGNALIIKASYGYKGAVVLSYDYYVDGKKISADSDRNISLKKAEFLVKKKLLLIYSCSDPYDHWLLLYKSDFDKFNITYPDSLLWVNKIIESDM